ncbi:hypothetical protein CXB51_015032 [Gossypium anomalum]|uniref:DUF7745 domain-containing protein n=1 Tax=Gossypium anomalum TaxID=47600 RepID=A0A8J5YL96_9ROSI|nr:hypothetical protein CXB51_015032 [Gossypium anomalum]
MKNGLLDRVEGNANVHRWSEQTQLGKGDSITMGYMLELSDYTCISVTQNNLQKLKAIWNQWGNETKQSFYAYSCFTFGEVDLVPTVEEYTALLWCPRFQRDRIYSRAACVLTFGKKLMTITGMSEQWIMARIKENGESKCIPWGTLKDLIQTHPDEAKRVDIFALSLYGLMVFPKALGYVDEATTDLFHRFTKWVTSVLAILAETFRYLNACRRASAGRFVGCAQLLLAWFYSHFRLIDRVSKDVEWRAPWMIPGKILYRCSSFDWVPLLGIWGAIGYAPLLVLRQHRLRQFVPPTYELSEFAYRGADYKRKVSEISSAWNKTCRLMGVAISPATTPEYVEWRGRRVNDNIPKPSMEEALLMEEYLPVTPSELEIMKQEFERKNLELEKRIAKLKEKDILDPRRRCAKDRGREETGNRRVFRSVAERGPRGKAQSRILGEEVPRGAIKEFDLRERKLRLEPGEDHLKGELHQSKEQVRDRDYLIGEAIIQIREVAEHVRDLAVQTDVLSMMHESSSDVGRELALLLDRVKTLGIRAKAYL